ncbi:MAG TPA: hypothetical protein P5244_13970 [Syntrophales bacterium]|nr:hypothetical protein [Syntrophobacterales bacterium]HRR42336.1 hypothetical protein [Syntrophales bacterium]HRT27698.1 hypothetical protein [Syntrophales bacterium]HRT69915.1 hypothetical protein [Syntrophales bacterium]
MNISSYQVENILKAYSRHDRVKVQKTAVKEAANDEIYADTVNLSSGKDKASIFNKISYSLTDILLKGGGGTSEE